MIQRKQISQKVDDYVICDRRPVQFNVWCEKSCTSVTWNFAFKRKSGKKIKADVKLCKSLEYLSSSVY